MPLHGPGPLIGTGLHPHGVGDKTHHMRPLQAKWGRIRPLAVPNQRGPHQAARGAKLGLSSALQLQLAWRCCHDRSRRRRSPEGATGGSQDWTERFTLATRRSRRRRLMGTDSTTTTRFGPLRRRPLSGIRPLAPSGRLAVLHLNYSAVPRMLSRAVMSSFTSP